MVEDVAAVAGSPRLVRGAGARSATLRAAASGTDNLLPATIALGQAGGTTGEWAGALREVFGEFRAPTGVRAAAGGRSGRAGRGRHQVKGAARAVHPASSCQARPRRALQPAPSRSPWRPATRAWRSSTRASASHPSRSRASTRDEDPDVIGLSVLSGSHRQLVPEVLDRLAAEGVGAVVVVGGIIPEEDRDELLAAGVRAVYTPKDFALGRIMDGNHRLHRGAAPQSEADAGRLWPQAGDAGLRARAVVVAAGVERPGAR